MATRSSILAWRIPWTEELGGLQSMVLQRVRHNWVANTFTFQRGEESKVGVGAWGCLGKDFLIQRLHSAFWLTLTWNSLTRRRPGPLCSPWENSFLCLHFAKVEWNDIRFFVPSVAFSVLEWFWVPWVAESMSAWSIWPCKGEGELFQIVQVQSPRQFIQLNIDWHFEKCNFGFSESLKRPACHCQGQRMSFF